MQDGLKLDGISIDAANRARPFITDVIALDGNRIHSIHIIGSAATDEYVPDISDINTLLVLSTMDFQMLDGIASLGKKYARKLVKSPLLMTPDYIGNSLDVFPVEFLNISLIHKTVYGEDVFASVQVSNADLRLQCERDIKAKLVGLRQGYISSMGDTKYLAEGFASSFSGYLQLFRGILRLHGNTPPVSNREVLSSLHQATGVEVDSFMFVLEHRHTRKTPTAQELKNAFTGYYRTIEQLGELVDSIVL
ncbi:MAG: hypothetical protein HZA20_01565 [Nitrospirae bacterium]|nr:hypothetical protein [Nitrospirota bacterium]